MKFIKISLSVALLILLTGCKPNKNGTYIAFKDRDKFDALFMVSSIVENDQAITDKLKSQILGKHFEFQFSDEFIAMRPQFNSKLQYVTLNRKQGPKDVLYYQGEQSIDDAKLKFTLFVNRTNYLIMAIDYTIPKDRPIFIPIQFRSEWQSIKQNTPRNGRLLFCLKKSDN